MSFTPPSTPPFSPTTLPPRSALSPIPATPPTSLPDPFNADSQYDWMAGGWQAHDGPEGRFWIDKERYRVSESFIHHLVVQPLTKSLMLQNFLVSYAAPRRRVNPFAAQGGVERCYRLVHVRRLCSALHPRLFAELTGMSTSWRLPTETLALCSSSSRVREAS